MSDMDKMSLARGRLALHAGFWLALASKMQWVDAGNKTPGGVAATNGNTVWYNRKDMDARPLGEVVFIALHEIGHPMLCHLTRRGNRDNNVYAVAIDVVLNHLLTKVAAETPALKMVVPADACVGKTYGLADADITSVEAVYNKLLKQGKGGQGNGFDGHEAPAGEDGKPLTPQQAEAMEKDWTVAVQSAAIMAKQMGKLPGFLEELIGELIKPKVDWRTHLRDCITRTAKDDSSYRRFNRRHLGRRTYLPGQYSERIGAIGYFCDTSGSISTDEFKAAMGGMTDILEDLKPEVIHFGQCDTRLHSVDMLGPHDLPLPPIKVHGRGGTDMREAFEWACAHEHEIDAFILQTDGYIPALPASCMPNIPVVWIITTDAVLPAGCDFGTQVRVVL